MALQAKQKHMQPKEQIALFDEDRGPVNLNRAGEVWSLVVSADISWDEVRARIADDLEEYADDLHGRNVRLDLGERPLDLMEVRRISTLMRDGFKAAVIGIECTPDSVHRYAEQAFKLPLVAPACASRCSRADVPRAAAIHSTVAATAAERNAVQLGTSVRPAPKGGIGRTLWAVRRSGLIWHGKIGGSRRPGAGVPKRGLFGSGGGGALPLARWLLFVGRRSDVW